MFVHPGYLKYTGDAKKAAFSAALTKSSAEMTVRTVDEFKDIGIKPNGKMVGGFTVTVPAAYQICDVLGAGSFAYLTGVLRQTDPAYESKESMEADYAERLEHCIRTYNNMAKFSFSRLKSQRLVCSSDSKTVDGMISKSFVMVYNIRVFEAAEELGNNMPGSMQFREGILQGRDMTALFMNTVPFVKLDGTRLYRGILVQNRETGGRAIRLSNVVFDSRSGTHSSDLFHSDTRIIHASPGRVMSKMLELSDNVIKHQLSITDATKALKAGMNKKLANTSGPIPEKTLQQIARKLSNMKVCMAGISGVVSALASNTRVPTVLDMYATMLEVANSLSSTAASLTLRQAAYIVLFGSAKNGEK